MARIRYSMFRKTIAMILTFALVFGTVPVQAGAIEIEYIGHGQGSAGSLVEFERGDFPDEARASVGDTDLVFSQYVTVTPQDGMTGGSGAPMIESLISPPADAPVVPEEDGELSGDDDADSEVTEDGTADGDDIGESNDTDQPAADNGGHDSNWESDNSESSDDGQTGGDTAHDNGADTTQFDDVSIIHSIGTALGLVPVTVFAAEHFGVSDDVILVWYQDEQPRNDMGSITIMPWQFGTAIRAELRFDEVWATDSGIWVLRAYKGSNFVESPYSLSLTVSIENIEDAEARVARIIFPEDEQGESPIFIEQGSEFDLLDGVSAVDEHGDYLAVFVLDDGGFCIYAEWPDNAFIVTYGAVHPVTGEKLTRERQIVVIIPIVALTTPISDEAQLRAALLNSAVDTIILTNSITITDAATLSVPTGRTIAIDGDGHTLERGGSVSLFTVNGGNLSISNITLQGMSGGNTRGALVNNSGRLYMNQDAVITGFNDSGAWVQSGGTLTMNGNASINSNSRTASIGGVYMNNGTLVMNNNASISGNTTNGHTGGILAENNSSISMNDDASVSGNTAITHSGGVHVDDGSTLIMNDDALISDNQASTTGGGVRLDANSVFIMNGGEIRNNTATTNGGGVWLATRANPTVGPGVQFTMNGGLISGNVAINGNGGGIFSNPNITSAAALLNPSAYANIVVISPSAVIENNSAGGGLRAIPSANSLAHWNIFRTLIDNFNISIQLGVLTAANLVTFNSRGGSSVVSQNIPTGSMATRPTPDPILANHDFGGWFTSEAEAAGTGGSPFDFVGTAITAPITLYARWTLQTRAVTFDPRGGSAVSTQHIPHGGFATAPTNPTLANHNFGGWFTSESAAAGTDGTPFDFAGTAITAPITLYARWTLQTRAVTFDPRGGSAVSTQHIPHGGVATAPTNPTLANHDFGGWFTSEAEAAGTGGTPFDFVGTAITAPITLYARWTVVTTAPTITTTSLPNGMVNTVYSQTLQATGTAPITWTINSGALPSGLSLSDAGAITGTPTASGTSDFTVRAENAAGHDTQALSITINATLTPPTITGPATMTLTQGYAATFTGAFALTGNPAPTVTINNDHGGRITWNAAQNWLDIATGLTAGTYAVELTATNSEGSDDHTFTLTVNAPSNNQNNNNQGNNNQGHNQDGDSGWSDSGNDTDWRTHAQSPWISQHPQNVTVYVVESATLSVTASATDGGVLSFQWYRATGASGGSFVRISGATERTFSPGTGSAGVNRYRVVVTNTNNSPRVSGDRVVRAFSQAATVTVTAPAPVSLLRVVVGSYTFTHNGTTLQSDATPFIDPAYDRLMVPLRLIAEAMGANVAWQNDTRSVTISSGTAQVSLTIGEALPNGMGVPVIVNGRTFVPLRYVTEILGGDVRWDEANRAVYVSGLVNLPSHNPTTSAPNQTAQAYIDRRAIEEIELALMTDNEDDEPRPDFEVRKAARLAWLLSREAPNEFGSREI